MKERWFLWQDKANSPEFNMAVDEALLKNINCFSIPVLRLYEWNQDAITIGYTQKYDEIPKGRGKIIRRPTGGGIVFHKYQFTYTVAFPLTHEICKTKPIESYKQINEAVIKAFKKMNLSLVLSADEISPEVKRSSMVCFSNPTKYDILSGTKKIAGSAQRRTKNGLLHQGSIELENVEQLNASFIKKFLPGGFEEQFECSFENFEAGPSFLKDIEELSEVKYSQEAWNQKR